MSDLATEKQRLDKWMWHARIAKTRSLCGKLVTEGSVRVNSEKVIKPSRQVQLGDVITVSVAKKIIIYEITGFSEKRGSATIAAELFTDLSPPPPPKDDLPTKYPQREAGAGRPTKKERRQISSLKSG